MKQFSLWLKKLLSDTRFSVTISILIAFIAWLVISVEKNPVREATFSNVSVQVNVSLSAAGDLGLDIVSENYTDNVTVTVQGPNYIVSALKNTDMTVTADLSEVTDAGTYTVPLKAQRENGTSGYSFVNITPSNLVLTFDYIDTREFAVSVKADGISAVSGLIADEAVVSSTDDSKLTIRGSKTELDKIETVVALVKENEILETSKTYDADILLYDKDGNMLEGEKYTLSTHKVKVTVPICRKKVLPVTPTFSNEPYSGYGNLLVSKLSVDSVTVIGSPTVIDTLEFIELSKINFNDISTDKRSFDVSFSLPDGVRVLDSIETVTVNLSLSGYRTKSFTLKNSNITFKNVADGCTAITSDDIKNVIICGLQSTVNQLSGDDLYAEVDLSGKSVGEYSVTAYIKNRNNKAVWQVGTYNITVTIK